MPKARCSWPASTPSRLACLRTPATTAPTSPAGTRSPWGAHELWRRSDRLRRNQGDPEHIAEFPNQMVNITDTVEGGSFGFTMYAYPERLSYRARELAKDYTGTNAALWAIANAVYLSLMGPQGMREIGETIIKKSHYAKKLIAEIPVVTLPFSAAHFNEFVVNFDATGKVSDTDQPRAARETDLRRGGPQQRLPRLGPKRPVLRLRDSHCR